MTEAAGDSTANAAPKVRGGAIIQFAIFCCAVTMVIALAVAISAAG